MQTTQLSVLALLAVLVSCGPQVPKVIVATDPTWPPMEFMDQGKTLTGFDVELVREVAKAAGFEVVFRPVAWDSIFRDLDDRQCDAIISAVTINDERRDLYGFSEPYLSGGPVLVVLKDNPADQFAGLKLQKVGVQNGSSLVTQVKELLGSRAEVREYGEIGQAFGDLADLKIEGVVADTAVAAQFIRQVPAYKGRFKIIGQPLDPEAYGIVVRKSDTDLLRRINAGIEKVKASGLCKNLETKWLQ